MNSSPSTATPQVPVRGYISVFVVLLVLTVATVAVNSLDIAEGTAVGVAVSIATFKATLVAMFFMHLKGEKPLVFWSLGLTAVLFAALFAFVLWTEGDRLTGTRFLDAFGSVAQPVSPKPQGEGGASPAEGGH